MTLYVSNYGPLRMFSTCANAFLKSNQPTFCRIVEPPVDFLVFQMDENEIFAFFEFKDC